ncbi:type II secretion system protein GspG [bacterium E08(2017)]|nr:type II secretion system protein GspG [bacterium E08(2017)]
MSRSSSNSGFTLIELMVVVIIIAALAGMVLPKVLPATDSAKSKIARGDIANITTAIRLYKLHEGSYPKNLNDLLKKSTSKDWKESYLESNSIKDPWERTYNYRYPGSHNNTFDLWSEGPDDTSSEDNINSWE